MREDRIRGQLGNSDQAKTDCPLLIGSHSTASISEPLIDWDTVG